MSHVAAFLFEDAASELQAARLSAKAELESRRARSVIMPQHLHSALAWDALVYMFAAGDSKSDFTAVAIGIALDVSANAMERWIKVLIDEGLVRFSATNKAAFELTELAYGRLLKVFGKVDVQVVQPYWAIPKRFQSKRSLAGYAANFVVASWSATFLFFAAIWPLAKITHL